MSLTLTDEGTRAYGILDWAFADPPGRAAAALDQVNEIAAGLDGQALREVQDVGTMLSRLVPVPGRPDDTGSSPGVPTIGSQMSGDDTIGAQVLDLAGWKGYLTEPRGRGGQWTRGPATPKSIAVQVGEGVTRSRVAPRSRQRADARQAGQQAQAAAAAAREAAEQQAERERVEHNRLAQMAAEHNAKDKIQAAQQHGDINAEQSREIHQLMRSVRSMNQRLAEMQDQKEKHTAQLKLATEGCVALAGALLALILSGIGAPVAVAIAAALGPTAVQLAIERWKRL